VQLPPQPKLLQQLAEPAEDAPQRAATAPLQLPLYAVRTMNRSRAEAAVSFGD
jgi:hypothetical protein